ncbi:MAG: hypothetical protein ABI193_24485 [Minicystis sp.]
MVNSPGEHESEWVESVRGGTLPPAAGAWSFAEGQRIWLLTQGRPWQTLAIVPVDDGVSTYEVASRIAALGHEQGECIGLADLRDVQLNRVAAFLEVTRLLVSRGRRVVCAMSSIKDNLATIPLARASDGVILCLSLGKTLIASTEETIAEVGQERLVGSMLLRTSPAHTHAPTRPVGPKLLEEARA